MTKRSDQDSDETPPQQPAPPVRTPTFDRVRELQERFDLFANSELGRSLQRFEGLNSSLLQSLRLNSPLTETVKQMGRLNLPTIPRLNSPLIEALKLNSAFAETLKQTERSILPLTRMQQRLLAPSLRVQARLLSPFLRIQQRINAPSARLQERINSPAMRALAGLDSPWKRLDNPGFAAIYAARTWSDSLSESHWAAQSSMRETLTVFQRAAEEAAAMARVDVSELATAVEASLGSLPPAATAAGSAAIVEGADTAVATGHVTTPLTGARVTATSGTITPTTASTSRALEDIWKTLPFPVRVFLIVLWNLLFLPIYNARVDEWIKASAESRPQIIDNVNENFGEEYSRNLRCVRGAGINIREGPSKTAPIIGRLDRSQAVAVIETEGGFSRIQYYDSASGEVREGWAASGYLVGAAC